MDEGTGYYRIWVNGMPVAYLEKETLKIADIYDETKVSLEMITNGVTLESAEEAIKKIK